ncbi:hypothetical protein ACOMHN_004844 [Nucella lapillus]
MLVVGLLGLFLLAFFLFQLNRDDDDIDGSVSRYRKKGKSLSRSRFSLAVSPLCPLSRPVGLCVPVTARWPLCPARWPLLASVSPSRPVGLCVPVTARWPLCPRHGPLASVSPHGPLASVSPSRTLGLCVPVTARWPLCPRHGPLASVSPSRPVGLCVPVTARWPLCPRHGPLASVSPSRPVSLCVPVTAPWPLWPLTGAASRESLNSVYSAAGEINYGRIPVSGEISLGLSYDQKQSVLLIHVKDCQDLAPADTKHCRSNPYVKTYLLPDKTRAGKRKSRIKKRTLNPVYNETLSYCISPGELETRTLWVTVWHSDRLGRNDFLGQVTLPMDQEAWADPAPRAHTLQSPMTSDGLSEVSMQYKGELLLSLMYVTADKIMAATHHAPNKSKSRAKKSKMAGAGGAASGELQVMVKSARHLMAALPTGSSHPFVKG